MPAPRPPTPARLPAPSPRGGFLLAACQGGAEPALCGRQQELLPELSKGVWRRGVVTFRLPEGRRSADSSPGAVFDPPDDFFPDLVFARTLVRSFGQVAGDSDADRIAGLGQLVGDSAWDNVHVWNRDPRSQTDVTAVRAAILAALVAGTAAEPPPTAIARPGDLVLDCVIDGLQRDDAAVEPNRWWVGWHRASVPATCWPGGLYPVALPADKVSRAWLKLDEAIATFGLELAPGSRAIELGASPGGACQRLLEAGLVVTGVDPAVVDEPVASHPRFEQWRMRARDVRLKNLRGFDWVVADMNIDPTSTLESIGRVVTAPGSRPRGIIATLKLPEWSRASALPEWLALFRSWGYRPQARQLSSSGREICVVALR
jgi:hypothetical protein